MSNIGRSDEAARLKDYYSQREEEIEKKHYNTVSELKKSQAADLDKVQTQSGEEIQEIRSTMKEKLTAQDIKHQKEIELLKSLYQKKIEEAKRG